MPGTMCASATDWWCLKSVGLDGSRVWVGDYRGVLPVVRAGDGGRLGAWFTPKESCDQGVDKEEREDIEI